MVDPDEPFCKGTDDGEELFNELHSEISESHSEDYIKNLISNTGLEYVGQGDGRVVLLDQTGEYLSHRNACVVKINKYGDIERNHIEVENWKRYGDVIGDRLLRITDWDDDYRWLVQPYLSTDVTEEMLIDLELDLLSNKLKAYDINNRNCAKVEDRAVIIDYDQPIERVDLDVMDMEEREHLIRWKYS